jgi:hypothetical protein
MGKTDGLLDIMGARLDQRPAPILYVGPIRDFLTDQFEPRLMSLLDEAETLSARRAYHGCCIVGCTVTDGLTFALQKIKGRAGSNCSLNQHARNRYG